MSHSGSRKCQFTADNLPAGYAIIPDHANLYAINRSGNVITLLGYKRRVKVWALKKHIAAWDLGAYVDLESRGRRSYVNELLKLTFGIPYQPVAQRRTSNNRKTHLKHKETTEGFPDPCPYGVRLFCGILWTTAKSDTGR